MNNFAHDGIKPTTLDTLQADLETLAHANKLEKEFITQALTNAFTVLPDPNIEFRLCELVIPAPYESSLLLAQRAGQSKLKGILSSAQFQELEALSSLPDTATYVCDDKKNLRVLVNDAYMHIDDLFKENDLLSRELDELGIHAGRAGGFIHSTDEMNAEQWFRFYGHPMPSTARQLANLIDFLTRKRPRLPGTGNYYDLLQGPGVSHTALSREQRKKIVALTAHYGMTKAGQLLSQLVKTDVYTIASFSVEPDQYFIELWQNLVPVNLAQDCIDALDWYGSENNDTPHPKDLQQLLMAAIVLNIDGDIGELETAGRVQGYELYQSANVALHPYQVLRNLEQHLIAGNLIEAPAAPVAAYILMADEAPEFLVRDIPDSMTIGSPAWVAHAMSVSKIENMVPGSCRRMTYEQVQAYADLGPLDEHLEQQFAMAVISPLLKWGSVNGLIACNVNGEYSADDLNTVQTCYAQYTQALEQCSNAFSTPLPTRNEMALKELQRAMPDGAYLTNQYYIHKDLPKSRKISIHELFMSGDLLMEGWTGLRLSSSIGSTFEPFEIKQVEPYIQRLQNIHVLYNQTFDSYFKQLQLATATALKLALTNMPEKDRIRLEYGALSLFTVRRPVPTGVTQETQRLRDKYRGRYGVVICSSLGAKRYYYELFTLRAECISRPDLVDVFAVTATEYLTPTQAVNKDAKQWKAREMEWPLDVNAYLNGTKPVKNINSLVVVEKLYESNEKLIAPRSRSHLDSFFSKRSADTVARIIEFFPPAKRNELYDQGYGVAPLEAARKNSEERAELMLNLIIPFKSCIEDLTSGDPEREQAGVFGCALDGLAIMGAVAGVAPKFASIAMKTGSVLSRSIALIRLSASFALSLINPLDGYPSLFKKGASITKQGALLISGRGAMASSRATRKIRSIGGMHDALNAARCFGNADLKLARLSTVAELSQATDVLLIKRGVDWYQLDLETHQARGAKITNYRDLSAMGASAFA